MRRALTVSLLLSGALACSTRTPIDDTPPPDGYSSRDTLPKSSSLIRRLAEAADGYRDGRPKWVVAHRKGNDKRHHDVLGVFSSPEEAKMAVTRGGEGYDIFGPFVTPEDDYRIPESDRVAEVIVVYRNGVRKSYDGDSVDAVFWGLPAFDKFIVPYLSSVSSAEHAREQRELYRVDDSLGMGRTEAVIHKRGSF